MTGNLNAASTQREQRPPDSLVEKSGPPLCFQGIVAESSALREVLRRVEIVAPTDSTVLIQGETGTGKELIARAIHNLSCRRDNPFIKLNCAAIPLGLLESELFGHERGAFTGAASAKPGRFELAHRGTLFLDEIGDIPLELQAKLLRVLQEQEFERLGGTKTIHTDVRVVSATNRELARMVEERQFRIDLYYRINVFPIALPPLRERRDDIPRLVEHFVAYYAKRMNKRIDTIPAEAIGRMMEYPWPGNVRELQNVIEQAVILSPARELVAPLGELQAHPNDTKPSETTLEEAEREHILRVLQDTDWMIGSARGAAVRLGLPRTTLIYRMKKLGIPGLRDRWLAPAQTGETAVRRPAGDSLEGSHSLRSRSPRERRLIAPARSPEALVETPSGPEGIRSLAILPFENVGADPEMEYLGDGITESIMSSLSQLPRVRVMARSTVFRYKRQGIDPQAVGRDLGLHAVLTGRVVPRGDTLTISAELVEVENGWRLWGEVYTRSISDIFAVQEDISREISAKLRLQLTREDRNALAKRYTQNVDAYRDYLKGRYYCNKMTADALQKSVVCFQGAIEKDRGYALAYAGLADAYKLFAFFGIRRAKNVMPVAKEAALKALDLDDTLAEGHVALASIRKVYDWDWLAAEQGYKRALDLSPNYAAAHHGYADYLAATGRTLEALCEIAKAQELDTLSLVYSMEIAWNWFMAREYERALDQSCKTLEMEPFFTPAQHTLGLASEQLGKYDEAIAAFQKALTGSGGNPVPLAALAHAYAMAGRGCEATKKLDELQQLSETAYVPPYWMALVYASLGEKDTAFEQLERAYEDRDVWLVWLKREPRFDVLRPDPRFEDLLQRIGLLP
jgi:DNA-binding NtrC family response regulator/TolB-like protein/Tfp pilus assembly protein PilF